MGAKHVQSKDLCVVVYGPLFIIVLAGGNNTSVNPIAIFLST
jgi:hypothetical protein